MNRKRFIKTGVLAATLAGTGTLSAAHNRKKKQKVNPNSTPGFPLVISTWNHGIPANEAAFQALQQGGSAVDAAEKGVWVVEADAKNTSVGLGGFPDREGIVTLDACIMDHLGRAGSVCFVQGIAHPITIARAVMEKTPHVMLVGRGAELYAEEIGMKQEKNKLSPEAEKAWKEWLKEKQYKPIINIENHDTIGLLVMDKNGIMAGSCTTSGLAFKMHGRVGDSPIIGAGLFIDQEIGAATCTGLGETVLRTLTSHVAVECMRNGYSPQEACEEAIRRIIKKHENYRDFQVGILAINTKGEHGAYSIHKGFNYALYQHEKNTLFDSTYYNG